MQTGNVETFSLDENTWKGLTLTASPAPLNRSCAFSSLMTR